MEAFDCLMKYLKATIRFFSLLLILWVQHQSFGFKSESRHRDQVFLLVDADKAFRSHNNKVLNFLRVSAHRYKEC